jgi:hypothetical protein
MASYPHEPGAKGLTCATYATSTDAADAIGHSTKHLRSIALRALARLGAATVLQCVAITDQPRENLQPRYSELIRLGLVEPTGERRRNPSGKSAAVLCLTEKGRAAVKGGADV